MCLFLCLFIADPISDISSKKKLAFLLYQLGQKGYDQNTINGVHYSS